MNIHSGISMNYLCALSYMTWKLDSCACHIGVVPEKHKVTNGTDTSVVSRQWQIGSQPSSWSQAQMVIAVNIVVNIDTHTSVSHKPIVNLTFWNTLCTVQYVHSIAERVAFYDIYLPVASQVPPQLAFSKWLPDASQMFHKYLSDVSSMFPPHYCSCLFQPISLKLPLPISFLKYCIFVIQK